MRALIYDGGEVRFASAHPEPTAAAGEAIVRPLRAGVSRLDVQVAVGAFEHTGVMGHEFVGVVESVNGRDERQLTGKRVVGAASTFCRKCDMCQAGLREHCRERQLLGVGGRDGCLAERVALPVENLEFVPDSVDDDHAVFAEPIAAAIQARRQLTIEGKPYITVLGDGPLGLLMVQVMARLNASVRLVGRFSEKLSVCEKWGIKHRHLDDVGRRRDQDIVVDCTGDPRGLELAMQLVRPRGKIVLKSLAPPHDGHFVGADLTPIVVNEIEIIGSYRGPVREAVAMLARGEVEVVNLISRRMALEDGAGLIKAMDQEGVLKVLVAI